MDRVAFVLPIPVAQAALCLMSCAQMSGVNDLAFDLDAGTVDEPLCLTATVGFADRNMPAQTGTFEVEWDVTPTSTDINTAVALSQGFAGTDWDRYATTVRFNSDGFVDVVDGNCPQLPVGTCAYETYHADIEYAYAAGATVHIRQVVDVGARRYSVYLTSKNGSEFTLATDYQFRHEQSSVTALDRWTVKALTGTMQACLYPM